MPRIEVVTFDLDNTLWDVDQVIRKAERATRATRAWFNTHVPELNATLSADDFLAIRQRIIVERPELSHDLSRLRQEVFARAIIAVGRAETEAHQLAAPAFRLFLAERHKMHFFEDALDVLEQLASHHHLGALTNGNADIARLGLDRYFRFAFSTADVGATGVPRGAGSCRCRRQPDDSHRRSSGGRHPGCRRSRHRDDLGEPRAGSISRRTRGDSDRAPPRRHSERDRADRTLVS